jgi:hypothetical protein
MNTGRRVPTAVRILSSVTGHSVDDDRIAAGLAHGVEVGEQRVVPGQRGVVKAAARAAQDVALRSEHECFGAVRIRCARKLQRQCEWFRSPHSPRPSAKIARSLAYTDREIVRIEAAYGKTGNRQ